MARRLALRFADAQERKHASGAVVADAQRLDHHFLLGQPGLVTIIEPLRGLLLFGVERLLPVAAPDLGDPPAVGLDRIEHGPDRAVVGYHQRALRIELESQQHQPPVFIEQALDLTEGQ